MTVHPLARLQNIQRAIGVMVISFTDTNSPSHAITTITSTPINYWISKLLNVTSDSLILTNYTPLHLFLNCKSLEKVLNVHIGLQEWYSVKPKLLWRLPSKARFKVGIVSTVANANPSQKAWVIHPHCAQRKVGTKNIAEILLKEVKVNLYWTETSTQAEGVVLEISFEVIDHVLFKMLTN